MRGAMAVRAACIAAATLLGVGASTAYGGEHVEVSASVDGFECTDEGLSASGGASVPEGSGAYLRDTHLGIGRFAELEDAWSPFTNTRVVEWWLSDERWSRRDALTTASIAFETGTSGGWEHHGWEGDLTGPAGDATDVWQVWVTASATYRGSWLFDHDQVFVDCSGGTAVVMEPGPARSFCFETPSQPPECGS